MGSWRFDKCNRVLRSGLGMPGYSSVVPNINVNTESAQLRTELLNTFSRLDGQLQRAPFRIFTQNGPVGNVGAAATDLMSTVINFGTLNKNGTSILIFACGKYAANGNTKVLKLIFGTTNILNFSTASNGGSWTMQAELVYNGGSAQIAWGQIFVSGGVNPAPEVTLPTEAVNVNKTLKIQGTGTASDDVSCYYTKFLLLV